MAIKILHILETITNNFSISMQMLNMNNNPLKILEKYSSSQLKNNFTFQSFETLIRLEAKQLKISIMVDQILKITNNIVKHCALKEYFQFINDINNSRSLKNIIAHKMQTKYKMKVINESKYSSSFIVK